MASRKDKDFGPDGVDQGSSAEYERGLIQMGKPRSKAGKYAANALIYGIIIAFLGLNTLNLMVSNDNRNVKNELGDMVTTQYNPSFKVRYEVLGGELIKAWYNPAIKVSPVQLGNEVKWPSGPVGANTDGATPEAKVSKSNVSQIAVSSVAFLRGQQIKTPGNGKSYQEELTYSAFINGAYYDVSVTLGLTNIEDYEATPTLISPPTIKTRVETSIVPDSKPGVPVDWRKFDVKPNLSTQVDSWAKAWSVNNSVNLKQVTGDSSGDAFYAGLTPGTWEYQAPSLQILWAYERGDSTGDIVLEVQWDVKIPDSTIPDPTNPSNKVNLTGATQTQRMDLLVNDASSGLPKIVAWGPSGTYPVLKLGQNALTKLQFDALQKNPTSTASTTTIKGTN